MQLNMNCKSRRNKRTKQEVLIKNYKNRKNLCVTNKYTMAVSGNQMLQRIRTKTQAFIINYLAFF